MIKIFSFLITFLFLVNQINPSYAVINVDITQPKGLGIQANSNGNELVQTILLNVISLFFTVGGIGTMVYFIWGAVDWILAGGDKEKVAGARKKMTNALIGLALLSLSFVIINWIGLIVGFNPLGNLEIRNLGDDTPQVMNQNPTE